jgi:hypothetical protein
MPLPLFVALAAAGIAVLIYFGGGSVWSEGQQLTEQASGLIGGYSVSQIQAMIVQACANCGFPFPAIALGIAQEESGFNPNATNLNTNGTTDWGVFQINDSVWATQGMQPSLDPQTNVSVGVGLLCSYWSQYGNIQQVLLAYQSPAAAARNAVPNTVQQAEINKWTGYVPPPGVLA